jgi:hypothetical protein
VTHMMGQIRLPARRVLKSDAFASLERRNDVRQVILGANLGHPEGRISKGSGRCCDRLVVPVPCRQSRLAKTHGNSGHMGHYLRSSVLGACVFSDAPHLRIEAPARERTEPTGRPRIEWKLISDLAVTSPREAIEKLEDRSLS